MKVKYTEHAIWRLNQQLDYLVERNAILAAERLSERLEHFLAGSLSIYPRTGRFIPEKDIWETWIPRTKLIVWYVFDDDELVIIDVWHASQDRH